jgi:hypothetical protein
VIILASSYRRCNIRVTAINNTEKGVVKYELEDIYNILVDWNKSLSFEYYLICHDEEDNKHYHIVIRFHKNPVPFANIKSKFPYGMIEGTRNLKNSIQYLIHKNDKSKKQYKQSDVISNDENIDKWFVNTQQQDREEISEYIKMIDSGKIREYNQYEIIPIDIWSRNKNIINNAFTHYREKIFMDNNRNIRVVIFTGDTGTGKTTFAKKYCEANNKSYCISSSSNDFMQDYKGQDVMIFDDIRDTDLKFTDMLKVLDNHTRSTVVSRYYNKGFIGDTIILTSYKPLSEWYNNIDKESRLQLYRRITEQYQFRKDGIIDIFIFSEENKKYEYYKSIKNNFKYDKYIKKNLIDELLENMGEQVEIIENDSYIDTGKFVEVYNQEDLPFI